MGLAWSSDELTLQRMFSSAGLVAPASLKLLPRLRSGEEADIRFGFLAPAAKSSAGAPAAALESVWRFYAGNEPFGPMLRFRFLPLQTEKEEQEEVLTKEERKDQHQDEEEKKDKLAVLDELISSKVKIVGKRSRFDPRLPALLNLNLSEGVTSRAKWVRFSPFQFTQRVSVVNKSIKIPYLALLTT